MAKRPGSRGGRLKSRGTNPRVSAGFVVQFNRGRSTAPEGQQGVAWRRKPQVLVATQLQLFLRSTVTSGSPTGAARRHVGRGPATTKAGRGDRTEERRSAERVCEPPSLRLRFLAQRLALGSRWSYAGRDKALLLGVRSWSDDCGTPPTARDLSNRLLARPRSAASGWARLSARETPSTAASSASVAAARLRAR